ncbi:T9SS type B sorting domain-containing protein [Adhaeribacter soli]|uniref:T9SS type B sorting domain-containing protein n=1 Tax=Adhaeribacter soli TaxID=2607655 RepID=UPI001784F3DC|nr:gliding motility-associated C-terminal domain-containing protein [Adhaeribacter soli]
MPKPVVTNFSFIKVDSLATGIAGAAAISDKNGDPLFFTSGGKIATREKINGVYQPMANGKFFSGKVPDLLYSEMIVQSPGDSNLYYLFFTKFERAISTSVDLYQLQVDMRLNNGYGDVVPNSLQLVRKKVSPYNLTAFLHHNNRDTWVSAANSVPGAGVSDTIFNYLVTPTGILPPVKTKVTTPFSSSRMKASPNSEMFVVVAYKLIAGQRVQHLELYDFNRTTGVPTLRFSFPTPSLDYQLFSFAFSPDNSKLYAGSSGHTGLPKIATVYQYDLAAGNTAQVQQSQNIVYNSTNFSGVYDMQLAINGKLYLYTEPAFLAQINCPDFYGPACNIQVNTVDLNGKTEGYSLPTLNQTIFRNAGKLQAQATRQTICEGDTVQLSAYGAGADHFKWKLANGLIPSSDTLVNPIVNPTETTTYMVIGSSTCRTDTAYVKVTVLPKPKPLSISGPLQVHTYAEKQVYSVKDPVPGNKFDWQISGGTIEKGQGSSSIEVNWGAAGAGSITVTESNAAGCKWGSTSLEVEISGEPDLIIYNIITPNNDGKNDAFVIENLKWYPQNELRIFNRWGMEVYQSKNYRNNWKAEKVSSGIYYYLFITQGKTWKGWVEVVK